LQENLGTCIFYHKNIYTDTFI